MLTDAIISSEQWVKQLNADISELDPEINDIIEHEKNRQWKVRGISINVCIGPILFLLMLSLPNVREFHDPGTCLNKTNVVLSSGLKHVHIQFLSFVE